MESLRGHFLVAAADVTDENFARSVVLMLRHDGAGATGLVINRPMDITVADAMGDIIDEAAAIDEPLYQGGPCEGPIFSLHDNREVEGEEVAGSIRVTIDQKSIKRLLKKRKGRTRFFTGYAGWGPLQIESELARDGWLIVPASHDDIFADSDRIWEKMIARSNLLKFVRPDRIPPDASVN